MKYIIGTIVIVGVCLYFFREQFFVALGYIDEATKYIAEWLKK